MKRLVAYILALALVFPAHAQVLGVSRASVVGVATNPSGGGGGAAEPEAYSQGLYYEGTGPQNDSPWAIGSATLSPILDCDFGDHSGTTINCGAAGTLSEVTGYDGGSGDIKPGYYPPYTHGNTRASSVFRAVMRTDATTRAEVTTEDFIVRFRGWVKSTGTIQYLAGKYNAAGSLGYAIRITAANNVEVVVNGTTAGTLALDAFGGWVDVALVCAQRGAAGSLALVGQGKVRGSAATCPAVTAAAPTVNFEIGGRSNSSTHVMDGLVNNVEVLHCPLDNPQCISTVAAAIAAVNQKHEETTAVYDPSNPDPSPVARTRDSWKMCEIVREDDVTANPWNRQFRLGRDWMCIGTRNAEGTRSREPRLTGKYPEPAGTNINPHPINMGSWTKINAADTVQDNPFSSDLSRAPDGSLDADRVLSDAGTKERGLRKSMHCPNGEVCNFSLWVGDAASQKTCLWMRTATPGTTTYFDIDAARVTSYGTGLHDMGSTNPQTAAGAKRYGGPVGGFDWVRFWIRVDGTAAAENYDFGWCDASGSTNTTTLANDVLGVVWGVQMEEMELPTLEGEPVSSLMLGNGSSGTRDRDILYYSDDNIPATGSLEVEFMCEDSGLDNATAGNVSGLFASFEIDGSNNLYMEQTGEFQSPGCGAVYDIENGNVQQVSPIFADKCYALRDGQPHTLCATFMPNNTSLWVDGVQTLLDTTATIPPWTGAKLTIGYTHTFQLQWARCTIRKWRTFNGIDYCATQ